MRAKEINGFVGGITKRATTIFTATDRDGGTWYVCEGGTCVNKTFEDVEAGTWIDELSDYDCFTVNEKIESLDEFIKAIED